MSKKRLEVWQTLFALYFVRMNDRDNNALNCKSVLVANSACNLNIARYTYLR